MKKLVTTWTLIGFMLTAGFTYGQTYSEDFEDGDVSDWQQYRADEEMIQAIDIASAPAVLTGGGTKVGLVQDLDGSYTGAAVVLMGDALDKDYIVQANVYVYENHPEGSAYTGIVAYADSSKGYYVKMAADFDTDNRFRIYNNDLDFGNPPYFYTFYAEVSADLVDKTEGWHHMKIHVSTNPTDNTVSYHCWYDDIDLGTFIDESRYHTTSGQAGLFSFQQSATATDGIAGYFDNFLVEPADWVGIKDQKSQPVSMTLEQNFPNPFNPSTTISFDIQEAGNTALHVFNLKGELIRTLVTGHIRPGSYSLSWDGSNDQGQLVPAGAYVLVLSKGNEQLSRSMLMIK